MKILYLLPGSIGPGFDNDEIKKRETLLQSIALKETKVIAKASGEGPLSIESACDEAYCIPGMIKSAIYAEKNGYDGIIIGCAGDPGLDALKEAVSIPVVGPAQTTFALAALLGRKFSVITPVQGTIGGTYDLVAKYGFKDNFASVRCVDVNILDITQNSNLAEKRTLQEAIIAKEQDGADCIALGCMSLAFAGFDKKLSKILGIPIINPVHSALHLLETMVRMNITQSKKAYPRYVQR